VINKATKGCVQALVSAKMYKLQYIARKDGLAVRIEGTEFSKKFPPGTLLAYYSCQSTTVRRGFFLRSWKPGIYPGLVIDPLLALVDARIPRLTIHLQHMEGAACIGKRSALGRAAACNLCSDLQLQRVGSLI
jgi:hypothetical protein